MNEENELQICRAYILRYVGQCSGKHYSMSECRYRLVRVLRDYNYVNIDFLKDSIVVEKSLKAAVTIPNLLDKVVLEYLDEIDQRFATPFERHEYEC